MSSVIPTAMSEMTPEWLTAALGPDLLDGATVTGAEVISLSEGVGFIGEVAKIDLTYDDRPDDAPTAVIAKIPIGDPGGRMLGTMLRLYERESAFYDSMASDLKIRVPQCFHNSADPESGDYCLLLEDLGHLATVDQRAGATLDQATAILQTIARFHARWAGDRGSAHDWLPGATDPIMIGFIDGYADARTKLHATFPELLDEQLEETSARLAPLRHQMLGALEELAPSVNHGDFRLDNMFFDGDDVVLFDWQGMLRITPIWDVVYFLGTNISEQVLTDHHEQLLAAYAAAHADEGGPAMSVDEMMSMAQMVWSPFILMGSVLLAQLDFGSEAGQALFDAVYPRAINAATVFDAHSYQPPV